MTDLDILAWLMITPWIIVTFLFLAAWHQLILAREEMRGGS